MLINYGQMFQQPCVVVRLINVCMCIKFELDITYMFMVFLILSLC